MNLLHAPELILDCGAIATISCVAPGYNRSVYQDCSKCFLRGMSLLHAPELILDCGAIATTSCVAPGHNRSVCQDRSKCFLRGMNLLHAPELISDCGAIATTSCVAPGHNRSVCQDRSKCFLRGMNLLHASELISDCGAVATMRSIAPCDDAVTSGAPQCKGTPCCSDACLKGKSSEVVSFVKAGCLKRLHWIQQHLPVCSDQPQEALQEGLLGKHLQVPNFGGLWQWKCLSATTRQGYIYFHHPSQDFRRKNHLMIISSKDSPGKI